MVTYTKEAVIINGFQKGIADSPHLGLADIRNANIMSVPGEAAVHFRTSGMTQPPTVAALAFSAATTDIFTVSSTSGYFNGMAVTLNTLGTTVGVTAGRVYWIGNLTATTFKLYTSPGLAAATLADVTTAGSGTFSSYTLGNPIASAIDYEGGGISPPARVYEFILDDNGRVWWVYNPAGVATNYLVYLGNDTLTSTGGRNIAVFHRHIIVLRSATMDALSTALIESNTDLDSGSGWVYGWESISSVPQAVRPVVVGQDNIMYYGNSGRVGSIEEAPGSNFNPSSGSTYIENVAALDLPAGDEVQSLGELGVYLLVGGTRNFVYPWNRIAPSFEFPLILPENVTYYIVTGNQLAFLFTGNRGRIYVTNGSSVEIFRKIPDSVTGVREPYFAWTAALSWRNQLQFAFTATTNAGVAITGVGGIWAIDLKTGALRHVHQLSYGASGSVGVIMPHLLSSSPPGTGIYAGWQNSGAYGVDVSSTDPYTSFETRIDTEIMPLGTNLTKYTPSRFEFKLSRPLVAGESIRLSYRLNLTDAFQVLGTTTTATLVSDKYPTLFKNAEWVQLRVEMSSTATDPSYVPLTEIRMYGNA